MDFRINRVPLNFDELRTYVLKAFKENPQSQYLEICSITADILIKDGIVPNPRPMNTFGGQTSLNIQDEERVREIIWDLVIERILTIGINSANASWPFIKLTDYGNKVLKSSAPIPHDPSGYLDRVKQEVPKIDI